MNGPPELLWPSLLAAAALLILPLVVSWRYRLGLSPSIVTGAFRMSLQLALAGFYLRFLFYHDKWWLNILWLALMAVVASGSALAHSQLRWQQLALPTVAAIVLSVLLTVVYFNVFIIQLDQIFSARYLVVVGGMLLGNTLSANIIALTGFFRSARDESPVYEAARGAGASHAEAIRPFVSNALTAAFRPTIAGMATMGIVSLPGMMTGQMLGGSDPTTAIKYQIAIMLAILANMALSVAMALWLGQRTAYTPWGVLRQDLFKP